MSDTDLIETGIPAFDRLLGGGLPRHQSIIVTGAPGSGKTILTSQIAFAQARAGRRVVIATVTSESHDKLVHELRGFSFFDAERVGDDVFFLNAYPWVKKGPKESRDLLLGTVRDRGAAVLLLDGFRAVRDVWADEAQLREFLYELNVGLLAHRCMGLFTTEYTLDRLMLQPEATTLDGIIALSVVPVGQRRHRQIEVVKLRGRPHVPGEHHLHIDHDGVHIIPRLEATIARAAEVPPPSGGRATFDLPELDALLGGGLPRASSTLLAGSTGVGKTLTALHFAVAGARRGERTLFVSFYEAPNVLIARAAGIGLDLAPLVADGALELRYHPPGDTDADELLDDALARVRASGARRLVVDGLSEIEHAVTDPRRLGRLLAALGFELRALGVTSLIIKEIAKLVGDDVDFSATPLAVTAENLLFERHVELHGSVRRVLSVLKMRESGYDDSVREFEIGPAGLRVLARTRVHGALTGLGRGVLPAEAT